MFEVLKRSMNGSNNEDDLEDLDPEGRAALEETRSIILLLQVRNNHYPSSIITSQNFSNC